MEKTLNNSFKQKGFALIATVAILALVVMISLAMVSLSATVSRSSSNADVLEHAKANARLALAEAIAELQRTSGPDTRITASAKILVQEVGQPTNPDHPSSVTSAQAGHFTGVWESWEGDDHNATTGKPISSLDALYRSKYTSQKFQGWLVSHAGNGDLLDPMNPPSFLEINNITVPLVGENSVGTSNIDDQIHITPTSIDGGGRYAWWVSGENSKVKLSESSIAEVGITGTTNETVRVSQEASSFGGARQNVFGGVSDPKKLDRIITHHGYNFLDLSFGANSSDFIKENFHTLTGYSSGLLTNVATGGWKKDLSLFSEQKNAGTFNPGTLSFPTFGLTPGTSFSGRFSTAGNRGDQILPWSGTNNVTSSLSSVQWEFLVDWAMNYRNPNLNLAVDAIYPDREGGTRNASNAYQPLVSRVDFAMGVDAVETTNGQYNIRFILQPYIVLWNPYNVAIRATSDIQVIGGEPPVNLNFKVEDQGTTHTFTNLNLFSGKSDLIKAGGTLGGFDIRNYVDVLSKPLFEPGEARIYTPDGSRNENLNIFHPGLRATTYVAYTLNQQDTDAGGNNTDISFSADAAVSDIVASASTAIKLGATSNLRGVGIELQIITGWSAAKNPSRWYNVIQTEVHDDNHPIWFNPDIDLSQISDTEYTASALSAVTQLFMNSSFAVRTPENRSFDTGSSNSYEPPTTLGYAFNDPVAPIIRSYWNQVRDGRAAYDVFTKANKFDENPHEYLFKQIITGGDDILPRGDLDGTTYVGTSYSETKGLTHFPIKDIINRPIVSLGDLQTFPINSVSSYPPRISEPIGNSLACPIIPPHAIDVSEESSILAHEHRKSRIYRMDHSYSANHVLFDDWFVSSISAEINPTDFTIIDKDTPEVLTNFLSGKQDLINANYFPEPLINATSASAIFNDPEAWQKIASMIRVNGMFNINSTSVEAWQAVLSNSVGNFVTSYVYNETTDQIDYSVDTGVGSLSPNDAVFTRTSSIINPSMNNGADPDSLKFIERSKLTEPQIKALAEAIVIQIKQRGPFLSLSEFVNRQLRELPNTDIRVLTDTEKLARAGTIEAALLTLTGATDDPNFDIKNSPLTSDTKLAIDSDFVDTTGKGPGETAGSASAAHPDLTYIIPEFPEASIGSTGYGYPGWLKQGDILRSIAPVLSARDDTFKIRAYGSAENSSGNVIEVWCEAVVTRSAQYVDPANDITETGNLNATNQMFGRRYKVVSFKWLTKDEI